MRRYLLAGGLIAAAGAAAWFGPRLLRDSAAGPMPVAPADREVAWVFPADNGEAWQRLVRAAGRAAEQYGFAVDDSAAYPPRTTDVPELAIGDTDAGGRLLIRWYKLTGTTSEAAWVRMLCRRDPPPLAVVGGGTTGRAVRLAETLADTAPGGGPLLLLTGATAVHWPGKQIDQIDRPLMDLYPGRTFRLCQNNRQMAKVLLRFLRTGGATPGDRFRLACRINWEDDPYSEDFGGEFVREWLAAGPAGRVVQSLDVPHSVGGFYRPNDGEAGAVAEVLGLLPAGRGDRALLILPTGGGPARRVLAEMCRTDPSAAGRAVAVTGDSISFNTVYRDGHFAWDVRRVPVPLVFFTHQNPVAWERAGGPSGTDDLLRNVDLVRVLTEAAFAPGGLAADADALAERLRGGGFFNEDDERKPGTGECVVCVRPDYDEADGRRRLKADPVIEVYQRRGDRWRCLHVSGATAAGGKTAPGRRGGRRRRAPQ